MSQELPATITKRLQAVLNRVRRIQFLRGMFGVITCSLAAVMFSMAVDYFFSPLSLNIRWALFALLVITVTGSFWQLFYKPLSRRIELLQIARWLEIKHPELQERVSTAIELSNSSTQGISEELLRDLISEAEIDVQSLNPQVEVKTRKLKTWLWPTCTLAALFLTLFTIWAVLTDGFRLPALRVVLPFSLAYLAQAIARRMFGVRALKPMMSLRSMAARMSWSLPMRSSCSSTGRPSRSKLAPRWVIPMIIDRGSSCTWGLT